MAYTTQRNLILDEAQASNARIPLHFSQGGIARKKNHCGESSSPRYELTLTFVHLSSGYAMRKLTVVTALMSALLVTGCGGGGGDKNGSSSSSSGSGGNSGSTGQTASLSVWSDVINLPIVPVAAANLPNGKVLAWSANAPTEYGAENQFSNTYSTIFDPVTQSSDERNVTETGHDMFCPGTAMLADGRLLVNGGSSSQKTSFYNPASNSWTTGPLMNIPRGYEGDVTLADGSVLTLGGSWSGGIGGKNGEIWTPGGAWRTMSGIPIDPFIGPDPNTVYRGDNHLWLFSYTNGRVFHAGPSAAMHWITTAGNGSVTSAGNRGDDAYSMNGNAVMYDIGKILKTGGAPAYEDMDATANSYVIDLNSGTTRKIAPMNFARALHNSTVLPNGQVIITGGQTIPHLFSDDRAVLMAELWDPATETFTQLSPMAVPRTYHSFSLLLPDGRVLVGGGGLCGSCTANHANVQIFAPPYLFNGDGTPATRPAIVSAPGTAGYGSAIGVATDSPVRSFVLMRMGAVTHSIDNDQRRVPLQFSTADNRNYTLQIPGDRGIAPPGYYMLFALNANGTPSISSALLLN
jgi:hypothetical protein